MRKIVPGGIDGYITKCPKDIQPKLAQIRTVIKQLAPDAVETVSYFQFPGYALQGDYDYSGMFAWFSYKKPYIRLHVRPPVVHDHMAELKGCVTSIGAVSFPEENAIDEGLIKKMVQASLDVMKVEV